MTREDIEEVTRLAVGERVRAAVKAVLEQVLEGEITRASAGTRSTSAHDIGNGSPPAQAKGTALTAVA